MQDDVTQAKNKFSFNCPGSDHFFLRARTFFSYGSPKPLDLFKEGIPN